jgi:hypothetical protein
MPDNNYNYGASYVMNSDKESIDDQAGVNQLYREGLEFSTQIKSSTLTEDMPKKQTKPTVEASVFKMADDRPQGND